ncbi:unnamed protein product [Durusdinium trenchii]|uniref:Uncharacterized protein n=1 Tax=Durusdinium trenchii TaxID=1381693 RepID=A0ABP0QAW8_9DINO
MTPESSRVERLRSDLQEEAAQLRAELWGLCNGELRPGPENHVDERSMRDLEMKLQEMTIERDAAWAWAEGLETKLQMERLTARACATEAIEVEEKSEERISELLDELAAAEAEAKELQQLRSGAEPAGSSQMLLQEIHHKVLASLYQGEELKQQFQHCSCAAPRWTTDLVRPICAAQETKEDLWERRYELDVAELTERLHLSNNEMRAFEEERNAWARRAEHLESLLEEKEKEPHRLEEQIAHLRRTLQETQANTAVMLREQAHANWTRRQSEEEFSEMRSMCAQLEAALQEAALRKEEASQVGAKLECLETKVHSEWEAKEARPGAKLKQALSRDGVLSSEGRWHEPVAGLAPMLPPPKVVRAAEPLSARGGEEMPPNRVLQVFLDATVSPPLQPLPHPQLAQTLVQPAQTLAQPAQLLAQPLTYREPLVRSTAFTQGC